MSYWIGSSIGQCDQWAHWAEALEFEGRDTNYGLLKELHKVDSQMAKGDIKLKDEIKMKLTNDENMAHNSMAYPPSDYWEPEEEHV